MKRLLFLALMLGVAGTTSVQAQDASLKVKESTESEVHFHATNYGIFGLNVYGNSGGFYSPRGSSYGYLFGSGLWIGAQKMVTDTAGQTSSHNLVFLTYNPNSGASWAYPSEDPSIAFPPGPIPDLYHSPDFNQTTGEYTSPVVPPGGPRMWPTWVRTGETVGPMFPGHFEPLDSNRSSTTGTYAAPAFMPDVDEQFVSRFHDLQLYRYEMGAAEAANRGYPLNLLIEQNIYGWSSGRYNETVVIDYMVVNRSNDTLMNCVVGQASDPDLGKADNDHVEFYSSRPDLRITRAWTDREIQGTWGQLAMVLLEAPVTDAQGFVDNSHRSDYRASGLIGSFPAWTIETDPVTDGARYDFMTSGVLAQDDSAGDKRAMLASTTFNMLPGDTAHFVIAYAVLHGSFGSNRQKGFMLGKGAGAEDDRAVEDFATAITADYYDGRFDSSPIHTGDVPEADATTLSMAVAPNPASGSASVSFTLPVPSSAVLRLVDPLGRLVTHQSLGPLSEGRHQTMLDFTTLPAGSYVLVVEANGTTCARRLEVVR